MAGQNTSSAVMSQRKEPHDSLDYFPTPPWATRALCEYLKHSFQLKRQTVWEPACGEGHMARPLGEYFKSVYATDVHDYSIGFPEQNALRDFLLGWSDPAPKEQNIDWIITNPPFRLAEDFIRLSLERSRIGCAMFVRTSFLEGSGRYRKLFSRHWPFLILQFVERVPLVKGRLDGRASTATSYCWIIWLRPDVRRSKLGDGVGPQFNWIDRCRKKLERPADYPAVTAEPEPTPLLDLISINSEGAS